MSKPVVLTIYSRTKAAASDFLSHESYHRGLTVLASLPQSFTIFESSLKEIARITSFLML